LNQMYTVLLIKRSSKMGVVIGSMDSQGEKIFLGNNLTRSTKNYDKILEDGNLTEEEKKRILEAEKKKAEEDIIL
ncbi:MAG: hypothetical protein MR867_04375, partial [Eubacterium sp.]|nr:hypothetical protein [Eubacterium sp.]